MNIPKPRIVMVHGNGGATANDHWFPSTKATLEKLSLTVVANNFPDNLLSRSSIWLPYLKNDLAVNEETVLIGHSSGAEAIMRFAEENKIFGSVLVSACYTDLEEATEKISGYYDHPWNWKKIKDNQNWIIQFASTDDPYVPIAEQRFVSQKLNSEYHEFTNRGHFLQENFTELCDVLKNKLKL